MASIFDEEVSDSDEDMITCHVCLMRFNLTERKPKFLDCHHYFCINCIKVFSKGNPVACPTCRRLTNMAGRQIEELTTNNIVLRLVTIATDRARELAERGIKRKVEVGIEEKQQEWCTDCSFLAYGGCYKNNHQIQNYDNFYQDHVFLLKSVIDNVQSSCNQALADYKKIQFVHKSINQKLQLLNREISSRVASSNATIAELEDHLKSIKDVNISQQDKDAINKMNQLIIEFIDMSEKSRSSKLKARNLLLSYGKNLNEALITLLSDDKIEKMSKIDTTASKKDLEPLPSCSDTLLVKTTSDAPSNKKIRLSNDFDPIKVTSVEGKSPAIKTGTNTRV